MAKKLVIVESPAKAKTIGRYLGKDYKITASVGHIRDLPSGTLAVDVDHDFKPMYINMRGKEKVIRELKELSKEVDFVYIATDPDREGEAIAWHIANVLKIDTNTECRITFNEITKKAVSEAISTPRKIDMDLVDAQQARRVLDRLVGYELSPLLWQKIRKGLSAGRVQSVTTKIVMDRDAEIDSFIPEDYWVINSLVTPTTIDHQFKVRFHGVSNGAKLERVRVTTQELADEIESKVKNQDFVASNIKKGNKQRNPFPPFTTSTLQQEASRRLGFSSRKTMSVAQQLYEGIDIEGQGATALVSYIRTDSVRISEEAVTSARVLINERFGPEYVCKYKREFKNKNSAQDAHEAIRPTHFELNPDSIRGSLNNDQYRLYKLIWDRFLATQMAAAIVDTVVLDAKCDKYIFRTTGETVIFQGFLALYSDMKDETKEDNKDDDSSEATNVKLPELNEGDVLKNLKLTSEKKQTLPPPHFTEATLIKTLEENGIGRPSTYAPTITTIVDRQYVEKEGKFIKITDLGKTVTNMIADNFNEIVDVSFTADMENKLDEIESGEKRWVSVLSDFYPPFHEKIVTATKTVEKIKMEAEKTGEKCPLCNEGDLVIKEGRFGKFIACSNFPTCNYTNNIAVKVKGTCPKCGSGLESHKSRKYRNKSFYTCDKKGSNPECDFISWDLPAEGKFCTECNSYMVIRKYRGKNYIKCSNKDCPTNAKKTKKSEE